MVVCVFGLQFLIPAIFTSWKRDDSEELDRFILATRGTDMILISGLLGHITSVESVTGRCFSSSRLVDLLFSFMKFLGEDVAQATIQIIFLLRADSFLSTGADVFVLSGVIVSLSLSFGKVLETCGNPQALAKLRNYIFDGVKDCGQCVGEVCRGERSI